MSMAMASDRLVATESPSMAPSTERLKVLKLEEPLEDADSDRLGGYVWKFPSEGSNAQAAIAASYPRKCRHCARAWVSSYVNERRHWQQCPAETVAAETATGQGGAASLGVARRVWCEVDAALTGIQWRDDVELVQQDTGSRVAFHEMADVVLLETPHASFQITTTEGRRIVLQCRDASTSGPDSVASARALTARQWVEYLQMFSRFAQQHRALDAINEEPVVVEPEDIEPSDPTDELLREAQRLIDAKDVDALDEMLRDVEIGPAARSLVDRTGSSLLVQAIQRDAGPRVVRVLLHGGVDCNAKNLEGESPLLLAAAAGDVELLRVLLRAPSLRVNQRCALGATAFHAAANAGDVAALRALCEHGAVSPTMVDENGWTALHYAAACVSGREAMQFLCELVPELVDARCVQGNTALHVAAGYGCEPPLRVLLETAANPHVTNAEGHTAYHVALHNHHIACAMAVNEYMETPRETYERAAAAATKEDRVAPVEPTTASSVEPVDKEDAAAWAEYYTEDQIPYYYNLATGESTWHMPEPLKEPPPPPPLPVDPFSGVGVWSLDDEASDNAPEPVSHGQRLPLCMIPLVSPLVSLDDPAAATKWDSRRKKDRARRRSQSRRRTRDATMSHEPTNNDLPLPPPPPPPREWSLAPSQRRKPRHHHYEVQ